MADEKSPGLIAGWLKAGVTSICGLLGGAALMYVTPLVNSAVKPAKPVANFAHQAQGLAVTFQNRSAGGAEGWWDFGDGSALEPYSPKQESVSHTYARAGNYTVKLSLRNLLGEEGDRTVTVNIDGAHAGTKPIIESFQIIPLQRDSVAPAVFQVKCKVKNAALCLWSLGDDRPLETSEDTTGHERYVTLKEPGVYTLRLVAVNGKQTAEKSEQVIVGICQHDVPSATLKVTYQAVHVQTRTTTQPVRVTWPAGQGGNAQPFDKTFLAPDGFQIVKAGLQNADDPQVRNVRLDVDPSRTKVIVRGELLQGAPNWVALVDWTLERRSTPIAKMMEEIPVNLSVPGQTPIPIPQLSPRWQVAQKKLSLELRDGGRVVWSGDRLPAGDVVQMSKRSVRVSAVEQGGRLVLSVTDMGVPLRPTGN